MTPEDRARENIDKQLAECGWVLQDMSDMNIMAGLGVAVREFPLTTGEADYGLYIDGKVAGASSYSMRLRLQQTARFPKLTVRS